MEITSSHIDYDDLESFSLPPAASLHFSMTISARPLFDFFICIKYTAGSRFFPFVPSRFQYRAAFPLPFTRRTAHIDYWDDDDFIFFYASLYILDALIHSAHMISPAPAVASLALQSISSWLYFADFAYHVKAYFSYASHFSLYHYIELLILATLWSMTLLFISFHTLSATPFDMLCFICLLPWEKYSLLGFLYDKQPALLPNRRRGRYGFACLRWGWYSLEFRFFALPRNTYFRRAWFIISLLSFFWLADIAG